MMTFQVFSILLLFDYSGVKYFFNVVRMYDILIDESKKEAISNEFYIYKILRKCV